MRLTLRTLLAYLDNTLDPQDAELLRQKLEASGFATQLVQRIRSSLTDKSLSAPAPDSVHPIEEPNMMSNFLDSTLSREQIAEIEKACLESPAQLAEAAACHQILTMVLGRPADVPEQLRARIFAMVDLGGKIIDSKSGSIAGQIGPRYSDIDLTDTTDRPNQSASADIQPTDGIDFPQADQSAESAESVDLASMDAIIGENDQPQSVQPLGVDDSGVFQAAAKLREQSYQFAEAGTAFDDAETLAGDRPLRKLERSDYFEGNVRTSRIMPWLVSLALVGVLLFAIVRIFTPLMNPKVADNDDQEKVSDTLADPTLEVAPEVAPGDEPSTDSDAERAGEMAEQASVADRDDSNAAVDAPLISEPAEPIVKPETTTEGPTTEMSVPKIASLPEQPASDKMPAGETKPAETTSTEIKADDAKPPAMESVVEPKVVPASPDAAAADVAVATLHSDTALVARRDGDTDWKLMAVDTGAQLNTSVVCAPEYRAEFGLAADPKLAVTLVGATEIRWIQGEQAVNVALAYGKGIIRLDQPGSGITLVIGDLTIIATTESSGATIAFDLSHQRQLGIDPMVPENHTMRIKLTSVLGDFSVAGFKDAVELGTGEQFLYDSARIGEQQDKVTIPERLPPWIDPEIDTGSLEAEAATNLLKLVQSDGSDSLLLSLRVALDFRRNEVAALAGKSMLALGDASAYFGVDGLFSNPKQRLYWSSHLDNLREMLDRSITDAAAVRTAIAGQNEAMDNADGDTLFRLLIGYSQDQLKTGGDIELVTDLESGSMPVRVLASEHLRDISDTTLFFKPEEEVVSRREEVVKRWKVRLKKEPIRYADPE